MWAGLVPRLATGWRWLTDRTLEVTLRPGVTFHNGEVFDAEVVKLNRDEQAQLQQPHTVGPALNFKPGSRLEIIDPYTVRFVFPETDDGRRSAGQDLHDAPCQPPVLSGRRLGHGALVSDQLGRPVGHGPV
jgi:hypothetical protein